MFSNGNHGKAPVVAATYYFNPSSAQVSANKPDSMYVSDQSQLINGGNNGDIIGGGAGNGQRFVDNTCTAPDSRKGTCYEASECVKRGGMPMGRCGADNAGSQAPGSVCCLFDVSCGESATENFVYFRNPGYPAPYDKSRICRTKIGKISPNVCQFRLEFRAFDIAKPVEGNCSQDIFTISGQNENHIVPKICGLNNDQHYYVGVDESGVVSLHIMMLGSYRRRFDVLITQIECQSENIAPPHCLQYYGGTHGVIKSFNYDYSEDDLGADRNEGYPNDVDYMICIRKEPGFCSITYELSSDADGTLPFAIGSGAHQMTPYNSQWPVVAECRDDFIVIGGMRLCSGVGKLNADGSELADNGLLKLTNRQDNAFGNTSAVHRTVMTDTTPGPFNIRFVSNNANNARGFHIGYRQNPCK
ncbi:uncharacterized protein LOC128952702 [Oppia nitens]|uniref:uncharacterized protein LOC128952702 n=1 Tax=Oppia nitens TaxID=1686743 RepID=UPI0023DA8139|nr:uncharacterized protein LOC128952702 [Oppia nitens]